MIGLAFIIFGRKVRDADYGPAYPAHCEHCQNDTYMHPYKWRSWGHIFWIPLLPWFAHRELACPICGQRFELDKSAFKRAKKLSSLVAEIDDGKPKEDEFHATLEDFEATAGIAPPAADEESVSHGSDELERTPERESSSKQPTDG